MTAALLLTVELARKMNGDCAQVSGGVLARDGNKHADCSTCHAVCGKSNDMGLADAGFRIARTLEGLALNWACPSCGVEVTEATTLFSASADARKIAADALCGRCRAA
jgi:hypothetical protein